MNAKFRLYFCVSAFFILHSAFLSAQTPYYHKNRTFTPVTINLEGVPTLAELNAAADKLTDIIKGEIELDTTNTYAIEKQMAIAIGYGSALAAWNAATNYNSTPSNYPGKIFDNVGWVRGTKSVDTNWGAYIWTLQNKITFRTGTSIWWSTTNGIPVRITNVMVGSLGDFQPATTNFDIGPHIPSNFPGANQNDSGTYQVDITNVYYELSIPDIWITPRDAVAGVGSSNVQYTVTGTNIPLGVTWRIIPDGVGAYVVSNAFPYAWVTPGNVGTNYKVRATSVDNTNFYDQVSLNVIKVDILETNVYVGVSNTVSLHLIPDSSTNVQWEITPDLEDGASISGSSVGTSVVINAGGIMTNYTVRAYAVNYTSCYDTCPVTVVPKVDVTNIKFNWETNSSANDAINIRQDYTHEYDVSNGEWIKDAMNIPICYTVNKTVTIKARFTVQPTSTTSAYIWAVSAGSGGSLGDVVETNVTFSGGVSVGDTNGFVAFQVSGTTPGTTKKTTTDVWRWKMENANGSGFSACDMNTSGVHTVYTILAEPVLPWVNTAGSQKNAWTTVLDCSCNWAATATDETNVVANITTGAYSGFGKTYDGYQTHTTNNGLCHLSTMMAQSVVDCRDMSAVVELFSRILGGATVQVRRVNNPSYPDYDGSFNYKPIRAIGGSSTWTNGTWNFHQFGWHAGSVNDACLKLKESAPYVPVHDDLNGSYSNNLFDSGTWHPLAPDNIADFD